MGQAHQYGSGQGSHFPACASPPGVADQPPIAPGAQPHPTALPCITGARASRAAASFSSSSSSSSSMAAAAADREFKGSLRSYWATRAPVLGLTGVWRLLAANLAARCEAAITAPPRPERPRWPGAGKPPSGRLCLSSDSLLSFTKLLFPLSSVLYSQCAVCHKAVSHSEERVPQRGLLEKQQGFHFTCSHYPAFKNCIWSRPYCDSLTLHSCLAGEKDNEEVLIFTKNGIWKFLEAVRWPLSVCYLRS